MGPQEWKAQNITKTFWELRNLMKLVCKWKLRFQPVVVKIIWYVPEISGAPECSSYYSEGFGSNERSNFSYRASMHVKPYRGWWSSFTAVQSVLSRSVRGFCCFLVPYNLCWSWCLLNLHIALTGTRSKGVCLDKIQWLTTAEKEMLKD